MSVFCPPLRQNEKGPLAGPLFVLVECGRGSRILFDQRSRIAACWQGGREASELNPPFPARSD